MTIRSTGIELSSGVFTFWRRCAGYEQASLSCNRNRSDSGGSRIIGILGLEGAAADSVSSIARRCGEPAGLGTELRFAQPASINASNRLSDRATARCNARDAARLHRTACRSRRYRSQAAAWRTIAFSHQLSPLFHIWTRGEMCQQSQLLLRLETMPATLNTPITIYRPIHHSNRLLLLLRQCYTVIFKQ